MQITGGHPDIDEFPETGNMLRALKEKGFTDRAIALKQAAIDYRATLKGEQALAVLALVEAAVGDPKTGQDWVDAPMPLVKLATVEGSGLDVRGVTLLATECARRAAFVEPAKFGKAEALPSPPTAPQHSDLEFARRIAYALALGVRAQEREVGPSAPILPPDVQEDGGTWE